MDVDNPTPPTTRDPRLSRNKPALTKAALSDVGASSSPTAPRPGPKASVATPADERDLTSGDQLLRGLSELIRTAADSVIQNAEKEKLVKKKETTEGLLKKAKTTPSFPSIITFFQQARNNEDLDLAQMDDTINRNQTRYRRLESSFTSKLAQSLLHNSTTADERLGQLQDEIRELNNRVKDPMGETKIKSLEAEIRMLRDRLTLLEKTSGNHTASINSQIKQGRQTTERVDRLTSDLAQLPSESTVPPRVSSELEELKRITTALDTKLRSFEKAQQDYSNSISTISRSMDAQHKRLDASSETFQSLERRFGQTNERMASLERIRALPPPPPQAASPSALSTLDKRLVDLERKIAAFPRPDTGSFDSKVQALSEQLDQLQNLQAMKDELHFAELEELKKASVEKTEIQRLKENYTRLAEETARITQWSATATQKSNSHNTLIEKTLKTLQSLQVGLHSLETRYNHLSTEPIVQNTIAAVQELYPPAAQLNKLTEQIAALRNEAKEEIPPLKRTVEQLVQLRNSQEILIKRLQEETSQRAIEANQLRDMTGKIDSRVTAIQEQLIKGGDLPDKLQQLHANFDSLAEKYHEHFSKIQEQIQSREEATAQTKIELEEARHRLEEQVQTLSQEVDRIGHAVTGVKNTTMTAVNSIANIRSTTEQNLQTAASQQVGLKSLIDRFSHFERTMLADHQGLLAQMEALKESLTLASQRSPVPVREETVPESRLQSPKQEESLAISDTTSQVTYAEMAESNPTLALRGKKKKKRPRPSGISDDERSSTGARNDSPRIFSSPSQIMDAENAMPSESKKRSKKKKKRRLEVEEPITID
ncbi:uncharacterized protein ACLA_031990 [Aspergillus clavatus NRRL 1]|uniref:Paramyosin n=1 Tax=Aspergillus clavatus (strain ATCC 1007 / CBS 513.65 / DSM 816 / NCTC 3887 / NRRL 1 / QM 1276 / 107) TaxID=344612 RepID=A1CS43_ASPCL|nr:uncharacterized protein ACLA_031990 [Aspergillus clavatus NRRL 1]EAW08464.1 conserved hypothetical protein [Aspergillus clavatus NRRL 1]